jgi:hypothetical protein
VRQRKRHAQLDDGQRAPLDDGRVARREARDIATFRVELGAERARLELQDTEVN